MSATVLGQRKTLSIRWFLGWMVVGPVLVFGLMDASVGGPVGVIALPLGLVAACLLVWRAKVWPESLGVVAGCGVASMGIGLLDRSYYQVCPDGEPIIERVGDRVVSIASCPYMAPTPWLIGGSALFVAGLASYIWMRKRLSQASPACEVS